MRAPATKARLRHLATRLKSSRKRQSPSGFDHRLIGPMILGSILNPINSSMIAVALIPIGAAFGVPPSQTAWLVSGLYLATAVGQPVVGRLVDLYGPRPLYLLGACLVGAGGIMGTFAPSLGFLVASRVVLGLGTCAGYPAAMFLIRRESERTGQDSPAGVLTALAVSAQTIAVVGPTLGGLLIGLSGWHAIFFVNVPLSFACLVLGALRLPQTPKTPCLPKTPSPQRKTGQSVMTAVDLIGIVLFTAMLIALLLFLMNIRVSAWYLPAIAVVAGAGLVWRELKASQPFIDLRVLSGNRPLLLTYFRNLLTYVVSYAFIYGYTQWLEEGRGLSASAAGLILLPVFLTAIIVSSLTGRRKEIRAKLIVGGISQVVACCLLLLLHTSSPLWLLVFIGLIMGIPQGLNSLANQNAVYYQADPDRMGSSAGLLRTSTYLGAIVAAAANGAFLDQGADTRGLHELALFILVIAIAFFAVSLADRSLSKVGRIKELHNKTEDRPERTQHGAHRTR